LRRGFEEILRAIWGRPGGKRGKQKKEGFRVASLEPALGPAQRSWNPGTARRAAGGSDEREVIDSWKLFT